MPVDKILIEETTANSELDNPEDEEISFRCKIGKMGPNAKIVWIPKRYREYFSEQTFVEVIIRKLR